MKTLLTTLAAVFLALIATPNTAEANIRIGSSHTYVSSHARCGCPIYTKRVLRGYKSSNRPIYSYYKQPFKCNCRSSHRSTIIHNGHKSHSSLTSRSRVSNSNSNSKAYYNSSAYKLLSLKRRY